MLAYSFVLFLSYSMVDRFGETNRVGPPGPRGIRGIPGQRLAPQLLQPPGDLHERESLRRAAQHPHHGGRRRRRALEG